MSEKNEIIENSNIKNKKKKFEGWKIAAIVISIIIIISIIILFLLLFVFYKNNSFSENNSEEPFSSIINDPNFIKSFDQSNITVLNSNIVFGEILSKQNIFINSSGNMLVFGNQYYKDINGNNGIVTIYEKDPIKGWIENENKRIFSPFNNIKTLFGSSVWASDDLKYIYISILANDNGIFIKGVSFAILQSNNTYSLFFNNFDQFNFSTSVYCSSDSNDKFMCFSGSSVNNINSGGVSFAELNDNEIPPKIIQILTVNSSNGVESGTFLNGGGGNESKFVCVGFGESLNDSRIDLFERSEDNKKWSLKYQIINKEKFTDFFFLNQFNLLNNYLCVTCGFLDDNLKGDLLIYKIDSNNENIITTTQFNRGSVPVLVNNQLINRFSSSVSISGDSKIIIIGTQTNKILIYLFNDNILDLLQTIENENQIIYGMSSFISGNGKTIAFTTFNPINFNYGFQIYESL